MKRIRKPRVFLGSTNEAKPVIEAIHSNLEAQADTAPWTKIFELSKTTLPELLREANKCDFGAFVCTFDDVEKVRGEQHPAIRDNIILELGIFLGRLGAGRTFFCVPESFKKTPLPTDLAGVVKGFTITRRWTNYKSLL